MYEVILKQFIIYNNKNNSANALIIYNTITYNHNTYGNKFIHDEMLLG